MNALAFTLRGAELALLPSGAVWWQAAGLLCVADLHLGKSERMARRGGTMLPPYETADTLARLAVDVAVTEPRTVVCLGDSFDDDAAGGALAPDDAARLAEMQGARRWIWIAGNHDPAAGAAGEAREALHLGPLTFRHVALPGAEGELSGHYHPKAKLTARGLALSRRCLLHDAARAILPAYGTYTGGLDWTAPELQALLETEARALLVGTPPRAAPMPRPSRTRQRPSRAAP